ncbi:hypothetical protein SELMODRAFT_424805 [Selaginella moellendorffii]|uniref:Uncharacterized protein n=1 Tax=Selaginella moellendorffii TaxID=88036 RepID=D8SR28_SELML|nr:hypothetical protein SELMODRAFT_424805 [Selaginella moellendorffii]
MTRWKFLALTHSRMPLLSEMMEEEEPEKAELENKLVKTRKRCGLNTKAKEARINTKSNSAQAGLTESSGAARNASLSLSQNRSTEQALAQHRQHRTPPSCQPPAQHRSSMPPPD